MEVFIQLVINGLLIGGMYAIISIGMSLIFGIIRVVNFAHGEFLMIGMYAVYLLSDRFGMHPYVSAIPVVILLFMLGMIVQRCIMQPLLAADEHIQIFAMVGLSTALISLALLIFGADLKSLPPSQIQASLRFGDYTLVIGQVVMFGVSIALIAGLHMFLTTTPLGRAIRATSQNRNAALLMGVNVNQVYAIAFGMGAGCVGLASALVMPLFPVSPTIGTYFVLTAFVVVVLGGMRSLFGAFLGAMVIGLVDSLSAYYIAPDLKEVVYFIIFLGILVFRPSGLLGGARGAD